MLFPPSLPAFSPREEVPGSSEGSALDTLDDLVMQFPLDVCTEQLFDDALGGNLGMGFDPMAWPDASDAMSVVQPAKKARCNELTHVLEEPREAEAHDADRRALLEQELIDNNKTLQAMQEANNKTLQELSELRYKVQTLAVGMTSNPVAVPPKDLATAPISGFDCADVLPANRELPGPLLLRAPQGPLSPHAFSFGAICQPQGNTAPAAAAVGTKISLAVTKQPRHKVEDGINAIGTQKKIEAVVQLNTPRPLNLRVCRLILSERGRLPLPP